MTALCVLAVVGAISMLDACTQGQSHAAAATATDSGATTAPVNVLDGGGCIVLDEAGGIMPVDTAGKHLAPPMRVDARGCRVPPKAPPETIVLGDGSPPFPVCRYDAGGFTLTHAGLRGCVNACGEDGTGIVHNLGSCPK